VAADKAAAKDVIAHLKCNPQQHTHPRQDIERGLSGRGIGDERPDVQGTLDRVLRRLEQGNASRGGSGEVSTCRTKHVEILTNVHLDPHLRPHIANTSVHRLHQLVGEDVREVADKNRDSVAEPRCITGPRAVAMQTRLTHVGCLATPTRQRPVDDIVVEQCHRVQQFERGTRTNNFA
jgi:hypothetical protein